MKFCAEIQYTGVHSDLCFNCLPDTPDVTITPEHRALLHAALDEWLDRSDGQGSFWLGRAPWIDPERPQEAFSINRLLKAESLLRAAIDALQPDREVTPR